MGRRAVRRMVIIGSVVAVMGCGAGPSVAPGSSAPAATDGSAPPSRAGTAIEWPAPADAMALTEAAGLEPQIKEFLEHHVHAHLDVFVDGEPVVVPAGIGIAIDDPNVRRFDEPDGTVAYGGIESCDRACISPLHTHDPSGIIHTESVSAVPNTLGEFFIEWGVPLSASCVGDPCAPGPVAVFIDGQPYTGDPAAIELLDQRQIAIVLGVPPAEIPATADFSNA